MQNQSTSASKALTLSRALDVILSKFDVGMLTVASASLFIIMILVFLDAMFRYLFNHPLAFTFDIVVLYLMSSSLLSVLSYTLRHGGHISIDLFANMMNHRVYLVLVGLALIIGMFFCGIIAWKTAELAHESFETGEIMTGVYAWPLWIGKAIVSLSFVGLTARLFHMGFANIAAGLLNAPDLEMVIMHDPTDPEGEI